MFGLGVGELFVIFVLALLFIGPKKLPELARSLGRTFREFQRAKDDLMDEFNRPYDEVESSTKDKIEDDENDDHDDGDDDDHNDDDSEGEEKEIRAFAGDESEDEEAPHQDAKETADEPAPKKDS